MYTYMYGCDFSRKRTVWEGPYLSTSYLLVLSTCGIFYYGVDEYEKVSPRPNQKGDF
jgi:hypothetical protein